MESMCLSPDFLMFIYLIADMLPEPWEEIESPKSDMTTCKGINRKTTPSYNKYT